jgi:hypothetical protein
VFAVTNIQFQTFKTETLDEKLTKNMIRRFGRIPRNSTVKESITGRPRSGKHQVTKNVQKEDGVREETEEVEPWGKEKRTNIDAKA